MSDFCSLCNMNYLCMRGIYEIILIRIESSSYFHPDKG